MSIHTRPVHKKNLGMIHEEIKNLYTHMMTFIFGVSQSGQKSRVAKTGRHEENHYLDP